MASPAQLSRGSGYVQVLVQLRTEVQHEPQVLAAETEESGQLDRRRIGTVHWDKPDANLRSGERLRL